MKLALVIPCFNEAPRLAATFALIENYFSTPHTPAITLIFVDDGSTDNTNSQLTYFVNQSHSHFSAKLITHTLNRGKGAAIVSGWQSVDADIYGFSDADLAFGLTALEPSIAALANHDVVIAKRQSQQTTYSPFRNFSSNFLHFFTRHLTGVKASSPQSGWKFITAQVLKPLLPQLTQERFAFDLELLSILQQNQADIHELALPFTQHNGSSVKTRDGFRYLTDVLAISDALPFKHSTFYRQLALLTLTTSLILYGWIIYYGHFFSDDFTWLWFGKRVLADWHNIYALHAATFSSPVVNSYYAIGFGLFGTSAPFFFLGNILIHAAVAWLAGLLALELTNSRLNAWCTAFLVAIAGSAYEAIVWIGANMHSLATLSIVATLYCVVRLYKSAKWRWLILGLITQLLAYGTKEISIVLAPLIIVTLFTLHKSCTPLKLSFDHQLKIVLSATISSLLGLTYGLYQYLMQSQGGGFTANHYAFSLASLARTPFVILDLFVPLSAISHLLSSFSASLLGLATLLVGTYLIRKYWSLAGIPLALALCFFGILPTLFFAVINWWEPLTSRYTYLPHVGAALLISSILVASIKQNKRRVVHALTTILIIVSIAQLGFMIQAITTEYAYVYKSGSTLAHAASLLDSTTTPIIYIQPDHPFRDNHTHLVGALNVYANYAESQIIFLEPQQTVDLSPSAMLLYWEPEARQYELTSHSDIFTQLWPIP